MQSLDRSTIICLIKTSADVEMETYSTCTVLMHG